MDKNWYIIDDGVVTNIIFGSAEFNAQLAPHHDLIVAQDSVAPVDGQMPQVGWTYVDGIFAPPA